MSVAVSDALAEKIAAGSKDIRYLVKFRRRFWDIEQQKFVLEASATQLALSDVQSISASRESLDRKGVNRYESSNVTLGLKNTDNVWSKANPGGRFAVDSTARLGYQPQLMEFIIEVVYRLEDGNDETITMFTGRAVSFEFRPDADIVSVTLESEAILFKRADAENVSTSVANEVPTGTVDGVNKDFLTVSTGVIRVDIVTIDGVVQRLGADVKISQLDDPDQPAKLSFLTAPPIGSDIRVDYMVGLKDQRIEDLVGLLADEAGKSASERDITPVTFPNQVRNRQIFTSKADWDSGTLTDIESDSSPGDILLEDIAGGFGTIDDFEDGDITSDPVWTVEVGSWSVDTFLGTKMMVVGAISQSLEQRVSTPQTKTEGTWEFIHAYQNPDQTNAIPVATGLPPFLGFEFRFISDAADNNFYMLRGEADATTANPTHTFTLKKFTGGVLTTIATFGLGGGVYTDSTKFRWRITRDSSGEFRVYLDGVLKMTVTDTILNTSEVLKIRARGFVGSLGDVVNRFDDVRHISVVLVPPATVPSTGTWVSPVVDTGADLVSYGNLDRLDATPSDSSILYETATSNDGIIFDAFIAISPSGLILSAIKRFIKVRATLSADSTDSQTPIISELIINFNTTTTTIKLANFRKLTVFDAVSALAQISNFEWGFSRTGRMFFRPRTFSKISVLTLTLKSLRDFSKIGDGTDRVFNLIRASYGVHEKIVTPLTQNDPSPNSFDIFGRKQLSVGSTQILLDPDADIATGLAIGYLQEFKNPRRTFQLSMDLRPQLELADTLLLRILDSVPDPPWHVGDSSRAIGDTNIRLFGEVQQAAYGILARVLSVRHNIATMTTGLELEEVI